MAADWRRNLDERTVAALEVIYRHQMAKCNAVVRDGSPLKDRCMHLQREIVPEILAAVDAVGLRVVDDSDEKMTGYRVGTALRRMSLTGGIESMSAHCEWSAEFGELPLRDEGVTYWAGAALTGHYPPKRIQAALLEELLERRRAERSKSESARSVSSQEAPKAQEESK